MSQSSNNENEIQYSSRYQDKWFEYRHVKIPKKVAEKLPKKRLLAEPEWRAIGIQQSRGWMHYLIYEPEPHILLFRRPLNACNKTGKCPKDWKPPPNMCDPSNKLSNDESTKENNNDKCFEFSKNLLKHKKKK